MDGELSLYDVIKMTKDASAISSNRGFMKGDFERYNNFESRKVSTFRQDWIEELMPVEVEERRQKILETLTGAEVEILKDVTFISKKADVEAYIAIIQKLLKAGVFEYNERQKNQIQSQIEAEKKLKKDGKLK